MNGQWLTGLVLIVLVSALAAIAVTYNGMRQAQKKLADLQHEVTALNERIDVQRTDLRAVEEQSDNTHETDALTTTPTVSGDDAHEIDERLQAQSETIAALRKEVDQLREEIARNNIATAMNNVRAEPTAPMQFVQAVVPATEEEIIAMEQGILSRRTPITEKLEALRRLRAANARTEVVADQMAAEYFNAEHAPIRADIFRQLDGVTTPKLCEALLSAVAHDEAPDVREEAAETLEHFLPDEEVQEWLEYLASEDSDEDVRRQARRSLDGAQQYLVQPQ